MSLSRQVNIRRRCLCPFQCLSVPVDAWLITGGYNVGIIKLVGQAIRKANLTQRNKNLVAIGVCKWGSVKDVETLIKRPSRNLVRDLTLQEKALM